MFHVVLLLIELREGDGVAFVERKGLANLGGGDGAIAIEIDDTEWRDRFGRLRLGSEKGEEEGESEFQRSVLLLAKRAGLIDLAGDGDAGLSEDMSDLGLAESGGVVFESEAVVLLVDLEAAQAVSVGELAETAELLEAERRLQFVSDFEECHGRDYSRGGSDWWNTREVASDQIRRISDIGNQILGSENPDAKVSLRSSGQACGAPVLDAYRGRGYR